MLLEMLRGSTIQICCGQYRMDRRYGNWGLSIVRQRSVRFEERFQAVPDSSSKDFNFFVKKVAELISLVCGIIVDSTKAHVDVLKFLSCGIGPRRRLGR